MITYKKGDLLKDDAEALVCTVNCVGVMGKGIALQFKHEHPENYEAYKAACKRGEVRIGKMGMFIVPVINFPTKQHWKSSSKLEWIEKGLKSLVKELKAYNIESVAVPALGCCNGGLDWADVKPLIEKYLEKIQTDVRVYEPL